MVKESKLELQQRLVNVIESKDISALSLKPNQIKGI